ncbi:MAG TPA: lysine--tRNA ligase [Terriglobia bacterium]|nr:lysine--tRNA ligase [Terriglobia bacterium]
MIERNPLKNRESDVVANAPAKHWSRSLAEELLSARGISATLTCASGITPSGPVHVGNLRDVLTIWFVGSQLKRLSAPVRLMHSWDDFDRFRKVPSGCPVSYSEFIGRPVSKVPDPEGKHPSYAARFSSEFESSIAELGIEVTFKSQTVLYESGAYGPSLLEALQKRALIFDIINSFRTQPLPEAKRATYLPIEICCSKCFKDGTIIEIVDDAAGLVRYRCPACGASDEISVVTAGNVKLPWKVDWPMRWRHEGVVFEPGGKDHATAGGSYMVACEIARQVFNIEPPRFQGYEFIGLKGVAGKMSSSAGTVITPREALEVYQPEALKWLFAKAAPMKAFDLPVDRQLAQVYDEFDKATAAAAANPEGMEAESIRLSGVTGNPAHVPFKTVGSLVALLDGNTAAVKGALEKLGFASDTPEVADRIQKADRWLTDYLPEERIRLLESPNAPVIAELTPEERSWIHALAEWVRQRKSITEEEAQEVFQIPIRGDEAPEARKEAQRRFFKRVYLLLFGRENGPRLPTFLAAISPERYLFLLEAAH